MMPKIKRKSIRTGKKKKQRERERERTRGNNPLNQPEEQGSILPW